MSISEAREVKSMIRIGILEDNSADLAQLEQCLRRYEEEHRERFSVRAFSNPSDFLDAYRSDFDLIFLDIDLPFVNGMDVARQLRESDSVVTLVFITNLEQYAINGYEVNALDFVVKPINYYRFSSMLRKALGRVAHQPEKEVIIHSSGSVMRLGISQIYYVEIRDHLLIYHTDQGNLTAWGKLSDLEAELSAYDFARCSTSHLVNLRYVISTNGNNVDVAGTKLPISQRRRKAFYADVTNYLSRR